MNLVGKIFTVLIFAMSLVFMSFAVMVYSTHTNWKEEITKPGGYRAQVDELTKKNTALEEERNRIQAQLTSEKTAALQARAKAETENQILEDLVAKQEEQIALLTKGQEDAQAAFKIAQETMSALTKEVEGLRSEIRDSQTTASESFIAATEKANGLHVALNQLALIQERNQQLTDEIVRLRHLAKNSPTGNIVPVNGVVTDLGSNDLIEISIGSDEGLEVGHLLDVSRGSQYLGRVRVESTSPDKAAARILREYRQGNIQRGDRVATARQQS